MATTISIGRVTGLHQIKTSPNGAGLYTIQGAITESTVAATRNKARQLDELLQNPGYLWHYVAFPSNANDHLDGFYSIRDAQITFENLSRYLFTLQAEFIGNLNTHCIATQWDNDASETIDAAWSALVPVKLVSVPYSASNIDFAVTATRTTSGGSNQILQNPTKQLITYTSSSTESDWYASECKIYDSLVADDLTEANWVQVLDRSHKFAGDVILQNGLIRYKFTGGNTGTFFVWDTVSNPDAWVSSGKFKTSLTGDVEATIVDLEVLELTPDKVEWKERRHNGDDELQIIYTLRRGAQHCRIDFTTTSLDIDTATYTQLFLTGQYAQYFNSTANGAAGGGDINQDASHCYEVGYKTTANIVSGFALCDQPTKQPYDGGANVLALSLTFTTSQTRVFFFIGWSQDTSAFNLATGRTNAGAIALQALKSLEQETTVRPKAFVATS